MTDTADNTFVLHDLVVEFGVLGIQGHEGSHQDVVDCTVRDTSVDGIYLEYGAGVRDILDPGLLVSGNTVERTGLHYAIKIERTGEDASWNDSLFVVDGNTIDTAGWYGVRADTGNVERMEITNNIVSNVLYGLVIHGDTDEAYTNRVEIKGNQIDSAAEYGIDVIWGRYALIDGNTVTGGGSGIYAAGMNDSRVTHNVLSGGSGYGMSVYSMAMHTETR